MNYLFLFFVLQIQFLIKGSNAGNTQKPQSSENTNTNNNIQQQKHQNLIMKIMILYRLKVSRKNQKLQNQLVSHQLNYVYQKQLVSSILITCPMKDRRIKVQNSKL